MILDKASKTLIGNLLKEIILIQVACVPIGYLLSPKFPVPDGAAYSRVMEHRVLKEIPKEPTWLPKQ